MTKQSKAAPPFFARYAEDEQGYPRWDFESFYQQGLSCHAWGLPKALAHQALRHLAAAWREKGHPVAMWQVRAFIYGCAGLCSGEPRQRKAAPSYTWPAPPDPSWELVVCVYPDGVCDLDLVHQVSRRFWSEDNGFFDLPSEDLRVLNQHWFEAMGFEVMRMVPDMCVQVGTKSSHLQAVPQ